MAQSPERNAGTSEVIRYDLGWNAINAMLRSGRSLSGHERNCCFLNTGGQRFANVSAAAGLDFPDDGRVLALADWDYDGDLDFWVANRSGPQVRYLRNNHHGNTNRISFLLTGLKCNRDAVGAKLVLRWKDEPQLTMTQTVRSSDGYLSQSSKWVHFGLGDRKRVDSVRIIWPNGAEQKFTDVSANQWYRLAEGDADFETWTPPQFAPLTPSRFDAPPISDKARIVLLTPIPLPDLEYECEEGTLQSAIHGVANARLINVWATWCQPCLEELTEWAKHAGQYADVGLEVVAVNVDERVANDPRGAIENVCQVAERLRLPFTLRFASPGLPEKLDAIQRSLLSRQRPLPLPSSFLVDRHGQLRAVYKGPVDAETLIQDAKLVDADSARILDAALPFSGRWLKRPGGSHPLQIALKLIEGDYQDEALLYIKTLTSDQELNQRFASASLLNLLGALSVDKKQYPQAAEAFARALELDPTNRTAHIELGTLLLGINRGRAAETHFRHVLKATPDDPEQHYKLGLALLQQNKLAEAREQMQTVLKLRDDALAHWQMGDIFLRLRDAGQAIASYERAIELKPALATTANNLAWLLATIDDPNLQNPPEAVQLAKTICQSTDSPGANELDTLAAAYAAAEDYRRAVDAVDEAIEVATEQQDTAFADQIRARKELYKQRKPFRAKL